jgi:AAA domain
MLNLDQIAHLLGGQKSGRQVRAPGPGHSPHDRSLSIKLSATADDGFVVFSHSGDDAIQCRDYVRSRLGLPPWQPNGKGGNGQTSPEKEMAEAVAGLRKAKPEPDEAPRVVATYPYIDADGVVLFDVVRYVPKAFRQRRPLKGGGYTWSLGDVKPILYRLLELLAFPDATVFLVEGEKDADRVASLDLVATTISGSTTWTPELAEPLRGRDIIVLADNDEPGAKKAGEAAQALHGIAATLRLVLLPGLPDKADVSDWLDAGHSREELEAVCLDAPLWQPPAEDDLGAWDAGDDDALPPPRGWLLGNTFCRRCISSMVAPGGVGKSALRLAQLLSLAIGRPLFSNDPAS